MKRAKLSVEKKNWILPLEKNFAKYERECRSHLPGWKERGYLSITSIKWIYLSIFRSTKQPSEKRRVFFSSFSFYFYRSTLAITCQNAIIRHFNSMNIYHPVLSFTNILQVAVPIASFYFLLQRCARDRRPLRVIYARVCSVGTGLSPSIYYIRVTV